jgi:hypothetical protein
MKNSKNIYSWMSLFEKCCIFLAENKFLSMILLFSQKTRTESALALSV